MVKPASKQVLVAKLGPSAAADKKIKPDAPVVVAVLPTQVKVATGTGMAGDDSIVPAQTLANPHPRQSPISYQGK
jgi:hypothetical protein